MAVGGGGVDHEKLTGGCCARGKAGKAWTRLKIHASRLHVKEVGRWKERREMNESTVWSVHSVWLHSQFVHIKLIKDASGVVFRRLKKHSPALSIPSRLLSHCHLLIFPRTPKHFILLPNKRHYSKTACLKILSSAMKQKKTFTLPPQLVEAVKQKGEQVKAETHTNEPSSNVAFFLFINIFVLTFSDGFPFCFRTPHYAFEK